MKEPAATDLPVVPAFRPAYHRLHLPFPSGLQSARATYQDDFETPGISPLSASPRKHKRQTPNLRRNARGRPQMWQRLCWRLENLGFLFALAILDVLAIVSFSLFALRFSPVH